MKFINLALVGTVSASLLLSSCFKRDNADWTFEQDSAVSSELFQDVYKQMDETAQTNGGLKSCANISFTDTLGQFPNTVTVDFGTGCLGTDGRMRSGSVVGIFSGPWRDAGTTVSITLNNYKVGKYALQGTALITNTTAAGNPSYSVVVTGGTITDTTNAQTVQWAGTTTYDMVAGQTTDFASNGLSGITDDIYHIGGSANGVNRNGTPYTSNITEYLVRDLSCKWITDGTVQLTPQNGDPRTLNFGDGACDANVTFTFQQWTLNFILP